MVLVMKLALMVLSCLAIAVDALGASQVGLVASTSSWGRAEALTSSARGSDALYYNPALQAFNRFSLRLLSIEVATDKNSVNETVEKYQNGIDPRKFTVGDFYRRLDSEKPISTETMARLLDITVPYLGVSSIADLKVSSRRLPDTSAYDMRVSADVGGIAGFALSFKGIAIGYSQYQITRAVVASSPSDDQMSKIRQAVAADELTDQTVPFRDFSSFQYGGARGHNIGFAFRPIGDNPTGLALSVLNMGNARFGENSMIRSKDLHTLETKMRAEAQQYDIALSKPDEIPEMINAGVNVGLEDPDGYFHLLLAGDYDDIGGHTLDHKLGTSCEAGFELPAKLALLASWPILKKEKKYQIHMGFLGLSVFGGYRPGDYYTRGARIAFHFGYNKIFSIVKLEIEGFELTPVKNNIDTQGMYGLKSILGLTFLF